jgi:hypothetical protein
MIGWVKLTYFEHELFDRIAHLRPLNDSETTPENYRKSKVCVSNISRILSELL